MKTKDKDNYYRGINSKIVIVNDPESIYAIKMAEIQRDRSLVREPALNRR